MEEDAKPTGFRFYRTVYSHEYNGWCIFEQVNGSRSRLVYHSGAYADEPDAKQELQRLNREMGVPE